MLLAISRPDHNVKVKVSQLCLTLCDSKDYTAMEFSRPEYWSGLPFPSPEDLPNPGIEPKCPSLQVDSLPAEPQGKPKWRLSRVDYREMRGVLGLYKICGQW